MPTMARRRPAPRRLTQYERAGRRSRAALLAVQADASAQLADAHAALRERLQPALDALTEAYGRELARVRQEAHAAGDDPASARVSPFWLNKLAAQGGGGWATLAALISHHARTFGQDALDITRGAKAQAARIGASGAQELLQAAVAPIAHLLPDGGDIFERPRR